MILFGYKIEKIGFIRSKKALRILMKEGLVSKKIRCRKIPAIKRYKDLTGLGLRECKQAVEDFADKKGVIFDIS